MRYSFLLAMLFLLGETVRASESEAVYYSGGLIRDEAPTGVIIGYGQSMNDFSESIERADQDARSQCKYDERPVRVSGYSRSTNDERRCTPAHHPTNCVITRYYRVTATYQCTYFESLSCGAFEKLCRTAWGSLPYCAEECQQ